MLKASLQIPKKRYFYKMTYFRDSRIFKSHFNYQASFLQTFKIELSDIKK